LEAGDRVLDSVDRAPADHELLFLISGGTSALVEVLPTGMDLADLHRANAWLLGSGLSIDAINRVRSALSCIKAGRLGVHLRGRRARALLISDVPTDDPAIIGSGPLSPSPDRGPAPTLPPWLRALTRLAPPAPPHDHPALAALELTIVARLGDAKRAASVRARALGLGVRVDPEPLAGDAVIAGRRLAHQLLTSPPGVLVWGGETTVRLPPRPGRGGRNQSLALAAATVLAGHPDTVMLAAGTDGTDGPTEDAGAVVDAQSVARGLAAGRDPRASLEQADAGSFLAASGDLLRTGPTGTNVTDLVLGLKRTAAD
jgi:hydroxypyruvate reductase